MYTSYVIEGLSGFDWDAGNVGHILLHGVLPVEVEAAVNGNCIIVPASAVNREERWKLFARTGERYLVVVFTIRLNLFRAITAYDMPKKERELYASQID